MPENSCQMRAIGIDTPLITLKNSGFDSGYKSNWFSNT